MQIKAFSQKYKVSVDTIRYYEKQDLLFPKRKVNGYREYDEECGNQLKMIIVLKQLGFSLLEISQLINLQQQQITPNCNQAALSLFDQKISQLTEKIAFFQHAIQTLHLAKQFMEDEQQYEENQMRIQESIELLFKQLKEGGV